MKANIKQKLDTFFGDFPLKHYKKGKIVIQNDEEPVGIFYLVKGKVRQYAISSKGEDIVVNIYKENSFFPMSWAINNTPNHFYFEALTDITVRIAPKEKVLEFVKKESEVVLDLLSRVYVGLDGILSKMFTLMSESAYERIITELIIQSKRFGIKNGKKVKINITEKEIAGLTGLQRETVSRNIKILKDKNIINIKRNSILIGNLNH